MVLANREAYIKKYWKDFYQEPDIEIPRREFEMKIGLPSCADDKKRKNDNKY